MEAPHSRRTYDYRIQEAICESGDRDFLAGSLVSPRKMVTRARFERAFPSHINGLAPLDMLILVASSSSATPFQLRRLGGLFKCVSNVG